MSVTLFLLCDLIADWCVDGKVKVTNLHIPFANKSYMVSQDEMDRPFLSLHVGIK